MEIKNYLYKDKGCIRKRGFRPLDQAGFPIWDPRKDTLTHRTWAMLAIPNPCISLPSRPCPGKHTAQRSWERILFAGLAHRRDRMRPSWIFSVTSRICQIVHSTFSEREWGRVPTEAQDIALTKSTPLRILKHRVRCPPDPWNTTSGHIILCRLYVCGTCRLDTLWPNEDKNTPKSIMCSICCMSITLQYSYFKKKNLPASLHKIIAQQMLTLELTFAVLLWRR